MQEPTYSIEELFEGLPVSLGQFAHKSGLCDATLTSIRKGKAARAESVNKLLRAFSELYGIPLTTRNVTGIQVYKPVPFQLSHRKP